ncbi:microcystin degradation protein MlrC [Candidatus Entotheonella serta]|nr:microcystin degradation protein MlrC [Candidatus Entotheonella serta]
MAIIAHAGFLHETNTFAPTKAAWEDFVRAEGGPGLTQGADMLDVFPPMNVATGGFVKQARAFGHDLKPIAWCSAVPSAHVTREAFENFSALLLSGLAAAHPFDAVYLDLHGAMVTEHLEDGEGELIKRVREHIGPDIPLVVSLDLHSNTTPEMLEYSDGLLAYRTYPHLDMADTGARAARYLNDLLSGAARPAKARRALPFLMPLTGQCTMLEPTKGTYAALEDLETRSGVRHVSFTPGFPPADIHACGPVVVAYGDTQDDADAAADALYHYITEREEAFAAPLLTPAEAVRKARANQADKPIVLADVQDNCGAGGTSDTTGILAELVRQDAQDAAVGVLVDPEAALAAHQMGVGGTFTFALGGKRYNEGDPPFEAAWTVRGRSDGRFTCTGPFYKGFHAQLGPMAYLQTGGVGVIVATHRMQAADQEMFRHIGCEPTAQRILVLKSSVHFRGDFTDIASEIAVVEAPGAFVDRPEKLPYRNLRAGVRLCPQGPVYPGT